MLLLEKESCCQVTKEIFGKPLGAFWPLECQSMLFACLSFYFLVSTALVAVSTNFKVLFHLF